ncbi:Pr6Pr family membrane protein [Cnuibacter sp. UC19_7]|uniref:Pr6Pr family membrane protein n=1 Tax=Cnuibacter sp. UC19_7 TaxID=3350166 RepID=UPI00366A9899
MGDTVTTAGPAAGSTSGRDPRALAARIWFGAIAVIVAAALVIQITLILTGGQDVNSTTSATSASSETLATKFVRLFSYFTIQSNLFVLGTSIALLVSIRRDGPVWRVLRLDAMLGIIITGLVYETILAPLVHPQGWALAATIGFHYISPWATLIGWLIFGPRPRMGWRAAAAAFIWPIAWLVYTFVHGAITSWYPYPFLDVTVTGFGESVRNCLGILLIAMVIAAILTLLDKRLPSLIR